MAANTKANELFHSVVEEVSLHTIDEFEKFFAEKVDLDEETQDLFKEFKKTISARAKTSAKSSGKSTKGKTDEPKKKRALSPYNIYIQNKMKELKEQGHTGNLMKMAIDAYKQEKNTTTTA